MSATRKLYVSYKTEDGKHYVGRVVLVDGDTTEADIPAMLAVKHYADNSRADSITVLAIEDI